jgi:hypothetical protein
MSNIKKWSYIHKTYNECSPSSTLSNFYSLKTFKKNYEYWMILGIYLVVSFLSLIIVFLSKSYFFVSVLAIAFTAVFMRYLVEKKLSKDLNKYYEPNGISEYPFFLRPRLLSYVLFREKLEKEQIITANDIKSLIAWDEVSNEKIDRTLFFKSNLFIALMSFVLGLISKYFLELKLGVKELMLIALVILIFLWLAFMIFDYSNISKERRLNIYRFLKWFQIDSEKT